MKNRWIAALLFMPVVIIQSCQNSNNKNLMLSGVSFEKDTIHFPELMKGDSAVISFNFTNTGKNALVVKNIGLSCGCTTAKANKDTLLPGESGKITAVYKNATDTGKIVRTIVVETNTNPSLSVLYIMGRVN